MEIKSSNFSILMANYNKGLYIGTAIKSVLDQDYNNWELIIIDDGSTDNSVDVISGYLNDKRIKLYRNSSNQGVIFCQKKLIDSATAEWICILDSDDVLAPNALTVVNKNIINHKDYGFFYSQRMDCDKYLKPIALGLNRKLASGDTILRTMDSVGAFRVFKRELYFQTSGYDEQILYAEDMDLIIKLEEVTKFYFIDQILYFVRTLPDSQSNDKNKVNIVYTSHVLANLKAYKRRSQSQDSSIPNLSAKEMSGQLLLALPNCIKAKLWFRMKYFFIQALKLYPFNLKIYFILLYRLIKLPFYRIVRFFYQDIEKIYDKRINNGKNCNSNSELE
jgi:glycosyltransferase involved in cell wall biosynthesis